MHPEAVNQLKCMHNGMVQVLCINYWAFIGATSWLLGLPNPQLVVLLLSGELTGCTYTHVYQLLTLPSAGLLLFCVLIEAPPTYLGTWSMAGLLGQPLEYYYYY